MPPAAGIEPKTASRCIRPIAKCPRMAYNRATMDAGGAAISGIMQRRPIILYETLEALYQQVNAPFCAQRREKFPARAARRCAPRQVRQLEEQMQATGQAAQRICRTVDCDDPDVQFFFRRWETENEWQNICLAKLLVYTFLDITTPDWDESLTALRESARQLFSRPFVVFDVNSGGLSVRPWEEPGQPTQPGQPDQPDEGKQDDKPTTGDSFSAGWLALTLFSGAMAACIVLSRRRKAD